MKQQTSKELPKIQFSILELNSLLDSVPSGIAMVDAKGSIVLCNSELEKIFGYEAGTLDGQPIETLVPHKSREQHTHHREGFSVAPAKRKMGAGRDLMGLRSNGTEFPVEVGLDYYQGIEGTYYVASVVDISERKKIEETMKKFVDEVGKKNSEMEQFVYAVSHDLKSPLVTSLSFLSFLKDDFEKKNYAELPDFIERIEKAHHKMQRLIDDLLDLSRIGRIPLAIELIPLFDLLSEIKEDVSEELNANHITFDIPPNLPTIMADRKRLTQVFENLIGNAIKYASSVSGPKIEILIKDLTDEFQIAIKDNGPGISPEFHKKVFELFQRLQSDKQGTGVGLAIVARIMDLHGGRAWVESLPGSGAEFWISLPKKVKKEIIDGRH